MNYIETFFTDRHNFFNPHTLVCILILFGIFMLDYFTTIQILLLGGIETNPLMVHFIINPFILALVKMSGAIVIISLIKIMYDIIHTTFHDYYTPLYTCIAFAVPSGMTLSIVLQNLQLISWLISHHV